MLEMVFRAAAGKTFWYKPATPTIEPDDDAAKRDGVVHDRALP